MTLGYKRVYNIPARLFVATTRLVSIPSSATLGPGIVEIPGFFVAMMPIPQDHHYAEVCLA